MRCLSLKINHGISSFDRYAASRGLLFSHIGWIFFKPKYEKLDDIDKDDLNDDPGANHFISNVKKVLILPIYRRYIPA